MFGHEIACFYEDMMVIWHGSKIGCCLALQRRLVLRHNTNQRECCGN